jgi:murein DD-endopeptidase MepM/ murein hydrolase activator NlpD
MMNKPLTLAVFLVIACLAFGGSFIRKTGLIEEKGVLGGPSPFIVPSAEGAELGQPVVLDAGSAGGFSVPSEGDSQGEPVFSITDAISGPDGTAIQDQGEPVGPAFDRSGTVSYTVQKGDTLSEIASYFGISVGTIANANPGLKGSALKVGQKLTILPTSGVVYATESGDTLASISNTFGISQNKIMQFNHSVNFGNLVAGTPVIIPGGTAKAQLASASALPNFDSQFIMPANGYNWGILHNYNAVDIANSCGTPVVAAADGLVVPDPNIPDNTDAWNGGYGNFVLIEHPFGNGTETRYAHLEKITVQIGDYVKQGQEIGLMGQSGEATGCHVHFEVIGAHNPFAKS